MSDEEEESDSELLEEYGDVVINDTDALLCVACEKENYVIGGRMYITELKVEVVPTVPGEDKKKKISITFLTGGT